MVVIIRIEQMKDEIIDMYLNKNLDTVQISKIIGCSSSGVGRLLKRNGVTPHHRPNDLRLSHDDMTNICNMYVSGKTSIYIGKLYGLCDQTITNILRDNNIEIKRAVRYSKVKDHSYFSTIDSPQKAYFLGWMITDGSVVVSKTRPDRAPVISIEIVEGDREVLDMFASEIKADSDIVKVFEKRKHVHMRFASKIMSDDLAKYGVVPNKTWIAYLPILDEELMPHLIRGIFDGNGTITIDKKYNTPKIAFYGSEMLCSGIREYLCDKIGVNHNKVSKSTCYHVWWSGTQAKAIYDFMYKNCGDYYLNRKFEKFDKAFNK